MEDRDRKSEGVSESERVRISHFQLQLKDYFSFFGQLVFVA